MKLDIPYNDGAVGLEQALYIGNVKFDTTGIPVGVSLAALGPNIVITRAVCKVKTAFNAATTNVLTLGTNTDANNLLAEGDITEGTAAAYQKQTWVETASSGTTTVKAKFTQTGTAATAGEAEFYLFYMRLPA